MDARFLSKVHPEPNSGCWLWTACTYVDGYGMFYVGGKKRMDYAHRVSWALSNGPIPVGQFVLHKCDTPACVNPGHLFLGTKKDNFHDMLRKGRHRGQKSREARAKWEEKFLERNPVLTDSSKRD